MTRFFNLAMLAIFFLPVFSNAQGSAAVLAPIEGVYIPSGFDHNDFAEVIVEGYLPNPCYQRPEVLVYRNGNQIDIQVTTKEKAAAQFLCPAIIVPFLESAHLGTLPAGQYDVRVNALSPRPLPSTQTNGTLTISTAASNQTDDHLYALVDYVEKDMQGRKFYLHGYNYSDCLDLDQVQFLHNGSNAISVKPIMKKNSDHCPRKMVPFRYEINPPFGLSTGDKTLLHVRSANGKSVNALVDFSL